MKLNSVKKEVEDSLKSKRSGLKSKTMWDYKLKLELSMNVKYRDYNTL